MDFLLSILVRALAFFSRFSKPLARIGIGEYEEWTPGERLKILLAGYNGAGNTGSDVRVAALCRQIKAVFGADRVRLTVMTLFMCEAAGIMAGQGKPCIAYGSEVGRMEPFLAKTASRLCRKTYFITRTQESAPGSRLTAGRWRRWDASFGSTCVKG